MTYEEDTKGIGLVQAIDEEDPKLLKSLSPPYHRIFSLLGSLVAVSLPRRRTFDHQIKLKPSTIAPWSPIYSLSVKETEVLQEYSDKMVAEGKIQPRNRAAESPIFFVPEPHGGLYLCVDCRGLNKVTVKNRYPLPLMSELRDRVNRANSFTKLDVKDKYYLILVKEEEESKTGFCTPYGLYQYTLMAFGRANAPATCQHMMNEVLREFPDQGVVVYLYDKLIYCGSQREHEVSVVMVL